MAGEHEGHRKRMRERFLTQGLEGFAPHEILELALFYAIPQRNVNPLAHRLIDHFGSLHGVLDATVEELEKVDGVGRNTAVLLSLFSHMARKAEHSRAEQRPTVSTRREAEVYCKRLLNGLKQEHFYAVCLDAQLQVIHNALIAQGTISEVQAYPRLVVEAVVRHNAHAVVLCHNHPGGELTPSFADVETTLSLNKTLSGIGVALADHIIVAGEHTLSMVQEGLLVRAPFQDLQAASPAGEVRIKHTISKRRNCKAKE